MKMQLTGNVQGIIDLLGGGSEVEVTQVLTSGEKIATITVDDTPTDIFAPSAPSPTEVEVTQVLTSGTKIATIEVDGVNTDLYAPSGGGFPTVQNHPPHGTDFNNLKTSALYEIDNFLTSWYTNQPMPEGYSDVGQLYVIRSSNCIIQFAVNVQRAYFRVCYNISGNQWWSWRRIDNN
jgi:hypothetical protein